MTVLRNGCFYCNSAFNLTPCQGGCMVVLYCSKEHQEADKAAHQPKCEELCTARSEHLQERDRVLRTVKITNDWQTLVRGTTHGPFFLLNYTLTQKHFRYYLSTIHTTLSLESEMELVKNWCVPSHLKPACEATRVAPFLIRLNRDDELACEYLDGLDISRFHICPTNPASDIHLKMITRCNVIKTLLRVRVAVDLKMLRMTTKVLESKMPTEILDQVRQEVAVSPLVWKSHRVIESDDSYDRLNQEFKKDVIILVQEVHKENEYLWRGMFEDGPLPDPCKYHSPRETEIERKEIEALSIIRDMRLAWRESPGAMDYLHGILRRVQLPCLDHKDIVAPS